MNRSFLLLAKILICLIPATWSCGTQAPGPNIILILTDDQGWSQRSEPMDPSVPNSCSRYLETVNMNRLAREGIRFTSGYSPAAICTPTRRSILCGTTSVRSGGQFRSRWMPTEHLTLPMALKQANPSYQCAHFGKWGELMGATPEACGYDLSHGMTGNGTGGMPNTLKFKRGAEGAPDHVIDNDDPKRTRTVTDAAVAFMESNVQDGNPFYVQVSYYAVHLTTVTRESTLKKYRKKGEPDRVYTQAWAAMLEDLDHGVGRLLDAIDELNIQDNTYVFFLADNGARGTMPGGDGNRPSTNFPLNGEKGNLWEGGIRVPFMARGPGIQEGEICREAVTGYDLLPTFYQLAGGKKRLPDDVDGVSLMPLLSNPAKGKLSRPGGAVFFNKPSSQMTSIREGDFKLIIFWTETDTFDKRMLYNLAKDPLEQNDLAAKEPARADALQQKLLSYMKEVDAEMPSTWLPRKEKDYKEFLQKQESQS